MALCRPNLLEVLPSGESITPPGYLPVAPGPNPAFSDDFPAPYQLTVERTRQVDADRLVVDADGETGEFLWQYNTDSGVRNTPAIEDGRVYVGDWSGTAYALAGPSTVDSEVTTSQSPTESAEPTTQASTAADRGGPATTTSSSGDGFTPPLATSALAGVAIRLFGRRTR